MHKIYAEFMAKFPACKDRMAVLDRLEVAISSLCFLPFFEPVSALGGISPEPPPRLLGPLGPALTAWTRHTAYGTIAQLQTLTEAIIHHFSDGRFGVACILQRSLIEHCGRAAFGLQRVTESAASGSWEDFRTTIPKALFGTCNTDLENTVFADFQEPTAQRPERFNKFIDALERLAGSKQVTGKSFFNGLYSVLCDMTHASQRANQSFCRVMEASELGWTLRYDLHEEINPDAIGGALTASIRSLQAGYAASAMLLAWSFDESNENVVCKPPAQSQVEWIWRNVLDPELINK